MPVNKNAILRYRIIDRCLASRGRLWTWKDLLNEVNRVLADEGFRQGVSKTTLFEDLKDIEYRVYSADIEKITEGKTVYYRYRQKDFSINNQPLNDTEINQLKSAIHVLTRFSGNPQFDWIHEIIPAIESRLGLVSIDKPVISFESNIDYEGLPYITTLFNAIINKRILKCEYQDFRSSLSYEVTLHPYYLKQWNNRWYIFGYNEARKRIENFALDRIRSITEENGNYRADSTDWDEYFSDFIGVTKIDADPVEVKIFIIDAIQASYIRTNPLHQTQKQIRASGDGFETSIYVIPNVELEKLLLSFGEKIKVLSPVSLKNIIAKRHKEAFEFYKK